MKIVFAGTTGNSAAVLEALVKAQVNVVAVLTRLDSAQGRRKLLTESPVADKARELGLKVHKSNRIDSSTLEFIGGIKPDLGIVVAYGVIFSKEMLEIPNFGWVNLHFSLLPSYRGAAPVQRALMNGETQTGVTLFSLDTGMDSGQILSQQRIDIEAEVNSKGLLGELTALGIKELLHLISNFDEVYSTRTAQPLDGVSFAPKVARDEARIDFSGSAIRNYDLIRAMNPEPVAWFIYRNAPIRVLEGSISTEYLAPGKAELIGNDLVVGFDTGSLTFKTVQPAGKTAMKGSDWFRGLRETSVVFE